MEFGYLDDHEIFKIKQNPHDILPSLPGSARRNLFHFHLHQFVLVFVVRRKDHPSSLRLTADIRRLRCNCRVLIHIVRVDSLEYTIV